MISYNTSAASDTGGGGMSPAGAPGVLRRLGSTAEQAPRSPDTNTDFVASVDPSGRVFACNRSLRRLLGISESGELPAMSFRDIYSGWAATTLLAEALSSATSSDVWTGEVAFVDRSGRQTPVWQVVIAHRNSFGKVAYYSVVARDLSDVKRQEELLYGTKEQLRHANEQLRLVSSQDGLTGLRNHRAFLDRLDDEFRRSIRYGTSLSIVLLDVDRFKKYNDLFGHPAGDQVLKTVASVSQQYARSTDIVARYGGEEFVILLSDTSDAGAMAGSERLRAAIQQAFNGETNAARRVTVSAGISTFAPGLESASALIDQCETALDFSKRNGRNRVTHYSYLTDDDRM